MSPVGRSPSAVKPRDIHPRRTGEIPCSVPLILVSKSQDKLYLIIFCQWQRQIYKPYYLINLFNLSSSSTVRTLELFQSSPHMLGISNMKGILFQATKDTFIYQRVKLSIAAITESPLYCCCSLWFDSSWVKNQSELVSAGLAFLFYLFILWETHAESNWI